MGGWGPIGALSQPEFEASEQLRSNSTLSPIWSAQSSNKPHVVTDKSRTVWYSNYVTTSLLRLQTGSKSLNFLGQQRGENLWIGQTSRVSKWRLKLKLRSAKFPRSTIRHVSQKCLRVNPHGLSRNPSLYRVHCLENIFKNASQDDSSITRCFDLSMVIISQSTLWNH